MLAMVLMLETIKLSLTNLEVDDMKTDLSLSQIVFFATVSHAANPLASDYCPCNGACGCNDKPSCCEAKCACHGKSGFTTPEELMLRPEFEKIIESFDAEKVKTIAEFIKLSAAIKDIPPLPQ